LPSLTFRVATFALQSHFSKKGRGSLRSMSKYEALNTAVKHKVRHHVRRFRKADDLPLTSLRPTDNEVEVALLCIEPDSPVQISKDLSYRSCAECALFAGIPWTRFLKLLRTGCHPRNFIWPATGFSPDSALTHGTTPYSSLYSLSSALRTHPHLLFWSASHNLLSDPETVDALLDYSKTLRTLGAKELLRFPVLTRRFGDGVTYGDKTADTLCELCEILDVDYVGVMALIATGLHYTDAIAQCEARH
jgi:hypothetical protein